MTKDELIALRRERGKQELNIGDRVKVYDQDGNLMYDGKTAIIIEKALLDPTEFYYGLYVEGETADKYRGKGLLYLKNTATKIGKTALLAPFFAEDLELMKEPADEIKVGDRVNTPQGEGKVVSATDGHIFVQLDNGDLWFNGIHEPTKIEDNPTHEIKCGDIVRVKRETPRDLYNNLPYDMPFFVAEIERDCDNPMNDTFFLRNGKTCLNIHPHWLEKWDATKSKDNTITIPVKADLDDTYWDVYRAELVKEIAVKMSCQEIVTNYAIADYITSFATRIVDNLKKQSE